MNTTTFFDHENKTQSSPESQRTSPEPHLVVQILSVLAFGVFSIVGIALAFSAFWLAGLFLATIIAWTWAGSRMFGGRANWPDPSSISSIADIVPAVSNLRSTGNASFDAHRTQTLEQLEQESRDFEVFLNRLRDARDATEFDQFMDERVATAQPTSEKLAV